MNNLAQQILSAMAENNLTQAEIAVSLGVTQHAVSDWLRGRTPRASKLKKLTDYLASLPSSGCVSKKRIHATSVNPEFSDVFKKRIHELEMEIASFKACLSAKSEENVRLHETIRAFATAGSPNIPRASDVAGVLRMSRSSSGKREAPVRV